MEVINMKINVWTCVANEVLVMSGPADDYNCIKFLKHGTNVIELDRITSIYGDVLWIKHVDGWSKICFGAMKILKEEIIDFPLFHYSISNMETFINDIEDKIKNGMSKDELTAICLSAIKRELILLTHLNTEQLELVGLTLDEFDKSIKGKELVLIDHTEYENMKRAYDQVKEIKKIFEE